MGKQSLFKFISSLKGCLVLLIVVVSLFTSLNFVTFDNLDFTNFSFKNGLEVEAQSSPTQPQPAPSGPPQAVESSSPSGPTSMGVSGAAPNPYSEPVTKTVRNGTDGSGSTTLKIGTEIRDDSPLAVAEYTRLNQISGTGLTVTSCTQMGGLIPGSENDPKTSKGIIAHPTRRMGICQDGFYSLSNRMIDTAGNVGEWSEEEFIERDTVSPVEPKVEIGKSGDILGEYLSININGESISKATITITSTGTEHKDNVKTFTRSLDLNGNYYGKNLMPLECGEVQYQATVTVTDRAGNISGQTLSNKITTLECPRCTSNGNGSFIIPVYDPNGKVTMSSDFPIRKIPGAYNVPHAGMDFAGSQGTPILAAHDGIIRNQMGYSNDGYYGSPDGWANTVYLADPNGNYQTIYAHLLNQQLIANGQFVQQGQIIGYMGKSGNSTGIHLHFQVEEKGTSLNPIHSGMYNKWSPVDPKDYLGEVAGNLNQEQANFFCDFYGTGDQDLPAYPRLTKEEAQDIFVKFVQDELHQDTEFETNGKYTTKGSLGDKQDDSETIKSKTNLFQTNCGIWMHDFGKIDLKRTGQGIDADDGLVVINPYQKKAYTVMNGIFAKYGVTNGPCGVIGVPENFESVSDIPAGSAATSAWWQAFKRGVYENNRIYAFIKPQTGFKAHYLVNEVANKYQNDDHVWTYEFPDNDTYGANGGNYCKQDFSWKNKDNQNWIDLCPSGLTETTYTDYKESGKPRALTIHLKHAPNDNNDYTQKYSGDKEVWIVSHGMNNTSNDMNGITEALAKAKPNDIILSIDWRGSETDLNAPNPQDTDQWIQPTALKVKEKLDGWGIKDGTKLNFVGHSMGTMVVTEIARRYNFVNRIIYLDPPSYLKGFSRFDVNDKDGDSAESLYSASNGYNTKLGANIQRAFVGGNRFGEPGLCGNYKLGQTAEEFNVVLFDDIKNDTKTLCKIHGSLKDTYINLLDKDRQFQDNFFGVDDLTTKTYNRSGYEDGSENANTLISAKGIESNTSLEAITYRDTNSHVQIGKPNQTNLFTSMDVISKQKVYIEIKNFETGKDKIMLFGTQPDSNSVIQEYDIYKNGSKTILKRQTCILSKNDKTKNYDKSCNGWYDHLGLEGVGYEVMKNDLEKYKNPSLGQSEMFLKK